MKKQRLLTIREASDFLNLSVSHCYRLAREGVLPGFKGGGRSHKWLFRYGDVFRWSIRRSFTRMQRRARELLAERGLDYLGRPLGSVKPGHPDRSGPVPQSKGR